MVTDRNRRTPSGNCALIPANTEVVRGWKPGIGDDSERLDTLANGERSKRSLMIVAVVRATGYRTMFRRSSGSLLGVSASKPKRGRSSVNKGTREARSSRVITQPRRPLPAQVSPTRRMSGRSRRSSPRLGKPVTWRRATGGVVLDGGRVHQSRGFSMNVEVVQRRLWEQSRQHRKHRESDRPLFPVDPYDGRARNLMDLMHQPQWIAAACDRVLGPFSRQSSGRRSGNGIGVSTEPPCQSRRATPGTEAWDLPTSTVATRDDSQGQWQTARLGHSVYP